MLFVLNPLNICFTFVLNNTRHQLKGVCVSLEPKLVDTCSSYVCDRQGLAVELGNRLRCSVGLEYYRQRRCGACGDGLCQLHEHRTSVVGIQKSVISESEHHVGSVHRHTCRSNSSRASTIHPCKRIVP